MAETTKQLLEAHTAKIAEVMAEHEERMRSAQEAFEAMAKATLDKVQEITLASAGVPEPETPKPDMAWATAPDGEQLLVMNKPAADLIYGLFDRVQEVVSDIVKPGIKKTTQA